MRRRRPGELRRRATVSVVIPCYNYGHFLPGATASALNHRGLDIDVTIIDDASSDDSAAVAAVLAAADERVSVIAHQTNMGHIATYNEGLLQAKGDYLVLLSADDLLTPDSLTRAVALMEDAPSVGLCYGYSPEFEVEPPEPRTRERRNSVWTGEEWLMECARRGRNLLSTPEAVMRTSVFREIGGYDPAHPHAGDFLMWLRAACRSDVGRVNGPDQAFYRVHGSNMHLTSYAGLITDFEERRKAFTTFLELDGEMVRDPRLFRTAASSRMAREAIHLAIDALDAQSPDPKLARQFAEMALDTDPAVTRRRAYRVYRRLKHLTAASRRDRLRRRARMLGRALEWKIRWRHWRWAGL